MSHGNHYLSQISVLVVDPSAFARRLVINVLHAFGCTRFHESADGADALKVLKATTPDLIFTELAMQPLDGIELTRFLRQMDDLARATLPVIMVSGHSRLTVVAEARDSGINEFVVKPFSARSLMARVRETIERPRPFVRTSGYFGPDRRRRQVDSRREDRRLQAPLLAAMRPDGGLGWRQEAAPPPPVPPDARDPLTQAQVDRLIANDEVTEDSALCDRPQSGAESTARRTG